MNTEELRAALRGATAELETAPTFAGEVVRGGARRIRRRRLIVAGVAAATALAVGGTVIAGWQTVSEPAQVATDPRLREPTRGDLAGDSEFVDKAIRAWQQGVAKETTAGPDLADKLIGRPHVYWAGTVPGDKVAVLMQAVKSYKDPGEQELLRGVVGTRRDYMSFGVVAVYPPNNEGQYEYAYLIGQDVRNVLAFELDQPQYLSHEVTYDNMGKAERIWMRMESRDGMVLGRLPYGTDSNEPRMVVGDPARPGVEHMVQILGDTIATPKTEREQHVGLPWRGPNERTYLMWAGTQPAGWDNANVMPERFHKVLRSSDFLDRPEGQDDRPSPWYLSIGLPDGKIATIGEYQATYERQARVYAAVKNPAETTGAITAGGQVNLQGPLNVLVKLQGSYGWAAAAKGAALSYRTTVDGTWQGERADALLAPVGTVQIQVTRPGLEPVTVDIS